MSRWSALLSFAAARAVAASFLSLPLANAGNVDGVALELIDLLTEGCGLSSEPWTWTVACMICPKPWTVDTALDSGLLEAQPCTGTADCPEKERAKNNGKNQ